MNKKMKYSVFLYGIQKDERKFYIEINSIHEKWRGGHFTKEDILLLLSLDELSDEELGIKPREFEVNLNHN